MSYDPVKTTSARMIRKLSALHNIWKLDDDEKAMLDHYFLLTASGDELKKAIRISPDGWKLHHRGNVFLLPQFIYTIGGIKSDARYVLSMRINRAHGLFVALYKEITVPMEVSRFGTLEP